MKKSALTLVALGLFALSGPALASDHLANAAGAPGADHRDFSSRNPVAGNPSGGRSFDASDPTSVPGEGNPNAGNEETGRGTPAVSRGKIDDRSGGHGRGDR